MKPEKVRDSHSQNFSSRYKHLARGDYSVILGQWEREDFYNHLSNYTNSR